MTAKQAELSQAFGIDPPYLPDESFPPSEVFPKRSAVVVREEGGRRQMDTMTWGFPHQVRGASGKMLEKPVTNVRNYFSPFWRTALANPERRCLVPWTSFSEYGMGVSGKLPLHWFSIPSRSIACFAGVWRPGPDGALFAFLTTDPNELVRFIHPKAMPVILHDEDFDRWLNAPMPEALVLATPYPSQLMVVDR